jgi:hypothetical protein
MHKMVESFDVVCSSDLRMLVPWVRCAGIPYDVFLFNPAAPVEPNTFLYKPDGSPKYR